MAGWVTTADFEVRTKEKWLEGQHVTRVLAGMLPRGREGNPLAGVQDMNREVFDEACKKLGDVLWKRIEELKLRPDSDNDVGLGNSKFAFDVQGSGEAVFASISDFHKGIEEIIGR